MRDARIKASGSITLDIKINSPKPFEIDVWSLRRPRDRWPFDSYLIAFGSLLGLYLAFSAYLTLIILLFLALGRPR